MRYRWLLFTVNCVLMLVLLTAYLPLAAQARHDEMTSFFSEYCRKCEQSMLDARASLEALEPVGWDDALLAEYQVAACFMIHNATVAYLYENDRLPDDLHQLAGRYFAQWPDNPQNGWAPIEILGAGAGFSAGDFVLQVCPGPYYSLVNPGEVFGLAPRSYELSIFGPYPDHFQGLSGKVTNTDWAMAPPGSVAIAGGRTETADVTLVKLREQYLAAITAGEASAGSTEEEN